MGSQRAHDGADRSVERVDAFSVRADLDDVGECRDRVADFLAANGAPPKLIDEVRLVTSELASNVVRHTDRHVIEVAVRVVDDAFVLDLAGAPDPRLLEADAPSRSTWNGRGLVIARNVADRIEVVDVDGDRTVRCWFARTD